MTEKLRTSHGQMKADELEFRWQENDLFFKKK